jgi:sugar lactone lactonase YvrE
MPRLSRNLLLLIIAGLALAPARAQSIYERYRFTTVAGNPPSVGTADGTGSGARFAYPRGNAIDAAGNVYIADAANRTIRKMTPAGVVTTVAGVPGVSGFANGNGSAALFSALDAIAVDGAGNLYVTDNYAIRKITPLREVTTFTGLPGKPGSADGPAGTAQFGNLRGIAVDNDGYLYVVDESPTIRKIDPAGVVSTFAGSAGANGSNDGIGTAARFNAPAGIAIDSNHNLFVADTLNSTIRKITPAGVVTTFAGTPGSGGSADGIGATARFNFPFGVAIDKADNVYVSEVGNNTIRKITPAAVVTTLAGLPPIADYADGTGSAARFNTPVGISADSAANLYVCDEANQTIRKITAGGEVTTIAGLADSPGSVDGSGLAVRFSGPAAVSKDAAGNVYVADAGNVTIRKITPAGVVSTFAGTAQRTGTADGTGSDAQFMRPAGIAVDSHGNVFVSDSGRYPYSGGHSLRKITPAGLVTTVASGFNWPGGIAIDGADNIYLAEAGANKIRKITPDGVVTTVAGTGSRGFTNGTGSVATFFGPAAVAVTADGTLFVADSGNEAIRKITPAGEVTTVAGSVLRGSVDGMGSAARFYLSNTNGCYGFCDGGPFPTPPSEITGGIAVDGAGNVLVADSLNHTIRKVTPAGAVTTIAGLAGTPGTADGTGSGARFNKPIGLFVDSAGSVYVADTANCTIRIGGPTAVAQSQNIATRARIQSGGDMLIAGFIVTGSVPKKVALRAIGPSLANSNVPSPLPDPTLELLDAKGGQLGINDDWKNADNAAEVQAAGLAPKDNREAAFIATLAPNQNYTAVVRGKGSDTGVALVEVYDLNPTADSLPANLSTRGFVGTGGDLMIGGFILGQGSGADTVVVRALGPSLQQFGISNPLSDPTVELRDQNGGLLALNNDWQDTDQTAIESTGLAPSSNLESAIVKMLPPGNYTAIIAGRTGESGVGLVEVYNLQ